MALITIVITNNNIANAKDLFADIGAKEQLKLVFQEVNFRQDRENALEAIINALNANIAEIIMKKCVGLSFKALAQLNNTILGNLQSLELHESWIGDGGARALANALKHGVHLGNLQTLNLRANRIGDDGARALADALKHGVHLGNLQTLNLSANRIGDAGARALADALINGDHLASFQTLGLSSNSIGDGGARALATAMIHGVHLGSFQMLGLSSNGIGDDGARAIAEALRDGVHLINFQSLYLVNNQIGEGGARAFAEALRDGVHLRNLQRLNLSFNNIHFAILDPLNRFLAENRRLIAEHIQIKSSKLNDPSQRMDLPSFIKLFRALKANLDNEYLLFDKANMLEALERHFFSRKDLSFMSDENIARDMHSIIAPMLGMEKVIPLYINYNVSRLAYKVKITYQDHTKTDISHDLLVKAFTRAAEIDLSVLSVKPGEFAKALVNLNGVGNSAISDDAKPLVEIIMRLFKEEIRPTSEISEVAAASMRCCIIN